MCSEHRFNTQDSASGSILKVRNVLTQAYMALKGKVVNVEKSTFQEALANQEIRSMIQAFGCGVGDSFDLKKLRYDKIIILTDADVDGAHIRALLLTFLFRLARPLIEEGKIYVCLPPLFKIKWGKDSMMYCRTVEEMEAKVEELKRSGKQPVKDFVVSRFKGLGEMNPADLKETCLIKENRTLLRVTIEDSVQVEEVLKKLMATETASRKIFFESNGEML